MKIGDRIELVNVSGGASAWFAVEVTAVWFGVIKLKAVNGGSVFDAVHDSSELRFLGSGCRYKWRFPVEVS